MLWALVALAAVQAGGASAPPTEPADIVVRGKLHKTVETQVRAVSRSIEDRPFARFQMPVCIASVGLSPALGEQVVDRMMEDARSFGVPVGPDDKPCEPNVVLVFLDNAHGEIEQLAKRNFRWFAQLTRDDLRELRRQVGPVQAIRLTQYRQDDGNVIDAHPNPQPAPARAGPNGGSVDPLADALSKGVMIVERRGESSRISPGFRQETQLSLLVFERSALMDKTTRQIADYAAMRTFADVVPDPRAGVDTVLSLFDATSTPSPAELTAFDRGYLRGAYAVAANSYPYVQQAAIARAIEQEMGTTP